MAQGRNLLAEDYPDCINKGVILNLYDNPGLPEGISSDCTITEQLPPEFHQPEFIVADCKNQIKFQILDTSKFSECISNQNCILINGETLVLQ